MGAAQDRDSALEQARALYLDLMRGALADRLHDRPELVPVEPRGLLKRAVSRRLGRRGLEVVHRRDYDPARRAEGKGWPLHALTMIGEQRLANVQHCLVDALRDGVPGDVIETGVWRGGSVILMRATLAAYQENERVVWAADSFRGLPPPDPDRYPADAGIDLHRYAELAISADEVRANFARYGLLDDQVRLLEGWFRDTLPTAPIERLALLRLDGDMYESTWDALDNLYPKLSPGGFVIVDDYRSVHACQRAVDEYRRRHGIREPLEEVDWSAVYWRRAA
jgi:O-methyltransferase